MSGPARPSGAPGVHPPWAGLPGPIQLLLPGIDPPLPPAHGFFFGLFPDPATAERIAVLAQRLTAEHRLSGRPLKTERFHVTLHPLGEHVDLPKHLLAAAQAAAATVVLPPFELSFDRAASFRRSANRPFVLRGSDGLAGVARLRQALGAAMARHGLGKLVSRDYTPHVTMLYDDRNVAGHAVETISWTAHEFVLVHSFLGQTRHVPLARWPLRG